MYEVLRKYEKKYSQKGISLIEAVIYITIFAVLFAVLVNTVSAVSISFGKARVKRTIATEARVVSERLIREIRLAGSVASSASVFNNSPGKLTLNTIVSPGDETPVTRAFFLDNGSFVMEEGSTASSTLTSGTIVTRLVFFDIKMATTSEAVRFEMRLEGGVGRTRTVRDFQGSAVLRRSY